MTGVQTCALPISQDAYTSNPPMVYIYPFVTRDGAIYLITVGNAHASKAVSYTHLLYLSESAISHQLRVLKLARLVRSHKAGKNVFYILCDEHIKWVLEETYAHISER